MASPNKVTLQQVLAELEGAQRVPGVPTEGASDVPIADTARRMAGRFAEWLMPTPSTEESRALLRQAANRKEVLAAMQGKIKDVQALEKVYGKLGAQFKQTQHNVSDAFAKAQQIKARYKKVPQAVLEDLRQSTEVLSRVKQMLHYLQSLIQTLQQAKIVVVKINPKGAGPVPAPTRTSPLPPPSPPTAFLPTPPPLPTPAPRPTPPQPVPHPAPPPPPRPPEEDESIPEQPDRSKELEALEKALQEALQRHAAQHQELDPETEKLRETMQAMGDQGGLNTFKASDEEGFPPPRTQKLSPSMDERRTPEKGENQPALFTIEPPLQGHFRVAIMDSFKMDTLEWEEQHTEKPYPDSLTVPNQYKMKGKVKGKIEIPLPQGYLVDPNSLKVEQENVNLTCDDRGLVYLESTVPQSFELYFGESNHIPPNQGPARYHEEDIIKGGLSTDTEKIIAVARKQASPTAKAKMLAEYVQNTLEYSNDSAYNFIYKSDPTTYFQKIEQHKKADCDVANTYFAALCRRAGLPARLVLGHRADGSKNGKVELTSSRHAWAEIWDNEVGEWKSIDATPPGGEQAGGEALDANNPEKGVDIKTTPQPSRKHPHNQAQDLEQKLKEAKAKNSKKQLTPEALQELQDRQDALKQAQESEIEGSVKDNIQLLNNEADRLNNNGQIKEANSMREKAQKLNDALEAFKKDRANPDHLQALKEALKAAQELMQQAHRVALTRMRVAALFDRAGALKKET